MPPLLIFLTLATIAATAALAWALWRAEARDAEKRSEP
jgi:hypothetical protein